MFKKENFLRGRGSR